MNRRQFLGGAAAVAAAAAIPAPRPFAQGGFAAARPSLIGERVAPFPPLPAGQFWIDTTPGTRPWLLKLFDGEADVVVAYINGDRYEPAGDRLVTAP